MRMIVFLLGVTIAGMGCLRPAAAAPVYRWCASYEDRGDMTCAYDTFQQCLDTARGGAGGMCMENPAWHSTPVAPVKPRARRRSH